MEQFTAAPTKWQIDQIKGSQPVLQEAVPRAVRCSTNTNVYKMMKDAGVPHINVQGPGSGVARAVHLRTVTRTNVWISPYSVGGTTEPTEYGTHGFAESEGFSVCSVHFSLFCCFSSAEKALLIRPEAKLLCSFLRSADERPTLLVFSFYWTDH